MSEFRTYPGCSFESSIGSIPMRPREADNGVVHVGVGAEVGVAHGLGEVGRGPDPRQRVLRLPVSARHLVLVAGGECTEAVLGIREDLVLMSYAVTANPQ